MNVFLFSLLSSLSHAVPLQMNQQGRIEDADGNGLSGNHDLVFKIYDEQSGGAVMWTETITTSFSNGYYSVLLGTNEANNPLDENVLMMHPLWLELTVNNGSPMSPRHEIVSTPYAQMAGTAQHVDWEGIENLPADFADGEDNDTLASLTTCNAGEFVSWDGQAWVCVSDNSTTVDWSNIQNRPAGLDDGDDDTQLTASEVQSIIELLTVLNLPAGTTLNGNTILTSASTLSPDWSNIQNRPAGLDDGDDDTQLSEPQVESYVTNGSIALASGSTVGGQSIVASGPCANGELLLFDLTTSSWVCGQDADTTLTATDVQAMIEAVSGLALQAGATVDGSPILTENTVIDPNQLDTSNATDNQVLTYSAGNVQWGSASASGNCNETMVSHSDGSYYVTVDCGTYNYLISNAGPTNHWFDANSCTPEYIEYQNNGVYSLVQCGTTSTLVHDVDRSTLLAQGTLKNAYRLGSGLTCVLDDSGLPECWGSESYNLISTRPAETFSQISAGHGFICGIKANGTLGCWGDDQYGKVSNAPSGTFTEIDTARDFSCAMDTGNGIQCWGEDHQGSVSGRPSGTFSDLSSGQYHSCALDTAGTITCWGRDFNNQCSNAPSGSFGDIQLGDEVSCALATTGSIQCWGDDSRGTVSDTPSGSYTTLRVAGKNACAIDSAGAITCWGDDNAKLSNDVPSGSFQSISLTDSSACAVENNGTIACWGNGPTDFYNNQPLNGVFTQVQSNDGSACGILDTGNVLCWSSQAYGVLAAP